ncbi:MAG: thiamine-phosphate kinase [Kangiellaceae bacterium]
MNEFEIIDEFLALKVKNRKDVIQGVGDDCALLKVPRGQRLAVSMDTLVSGVHFLENCKPSHIAHKAIAVNLSDLAAAGAEPAWITVSLTLPKFDKEWLESFHSGLKKMAEYFGIQIIGGDTCKGPLSITIQAHGFVPQQVFCRRDTAKAGELICVTGTLGDAALGLLVAQGKLKINNEEDKAFLIKKYETPFPRMASGISLRNRATAGIDISDGLLADVNHLSQASNVGILLRWERIPLSNAAKNISDKTLVMKSALTGGDDYELCFTVKEDELEATQQALEMVGAECTAIGRLSGKPGVRVLNGKKEIELDSLGFQHFD